MKKWIIGQPSEWLIEQARIHGQNIENKNHVITNDFKNHVINRHGRPESEEPIGQIAVTDDDFNNLIEVVNYPDKILLGTLGKKKVKTINYLKKLNKGTILYAEEDLNSNKNKELRGKTMVIRRKDVDDKLFKHFASCKGKNDMTNIKIIASADVGGYPNFYTDKSEVVANPTLPAEQLQGHTHTENIPQISVEIKKKNNEKQ